MAYLQPRTGNYFGFMPVTGNDARAQQVNAYCVSSSEAADIQTGDALVLTSNGTARVVTGAFAGLLLGVAAGPMTAGAGSTSATLVSNSSQMLLVYDSPTQMFVTCDTTSGLIAQTGVYKSYAVLASGVIGSTGANQTRRSVMAISGVTGSSAGGPFKVVGLHPIEGMFPSGLSTDAGSAGVAASVRKWLVQPSNHVFGALDNRGVVTT